MRFLKEIVSWDSWGPAPACLTPRGQSPPDPTLLSEQWLPAPSPRGSEERPPPCALILPSPASAAAVAFHCSRSLLQSLMAPRLCPARGWMLPAQLSLQLSLLLRRLRVLRPLQPLQLHRLPKRRDLRELQAQHEGPALPALPPGLLPQQLGGAG